MSALFETHTMTVKKNVITKVDRQPVSNLEEVITGVRCRITGTQNEGDSDERTKLFVSAKNYRTIVGGLHKNYEIVVDGEFTQSYIITKEPVWAGGTNHHIECILKERV